MSFIKVKSLVFSRNFDEKNEDSSVSIDMNQECRRDWKQLGYL